MKPFFSYYGAKYRGAPHFGRPRDTLVIEPFAGSACYSVYWDCPNVALYDVSQDICEVWDFLIDCSVRDIENLPDTLKTEDDFTAITGSTRKLVAFWVAKGRARPSTKVSPWYFSHAHLADRQCMVWGPAVKKRIISQKPNIAAWTIENRSYDTIPLRRAHWHVDPPYVGKPRRKYPHNDIDYDALAKWCLNLPGHVDVCENVGASWLPFEPLYEVLSSRGTTSGKVSKEAVFRIDNTKGSR